MTETQFEADDRQLKCSREVLVRDPPLSELLNLQGAGALQNRCPFGRLFLVSLNDRER